MTGWSTAPDSQLNPNRQTLTSLNGLAAGSYVVMASLWGSNSDVTSYARYYCDIVTPNATTQTISDLPEAHADGQTGVSGMALNSADTVVTSSAPFSIQLVCASLVGNGVSVRQTRLVAIKVGTLTQQ